MEWMTYEKLGVGWEWNTTPQVELQLPCLIQAWAEFTSESSMACFSATVQKIEWTVEVVSEEVIQDLNRTFRQKPAVTDVLSFANFDVINSQEWKEIALPALDLGSVHICWEQAKRQAVEHDVSVENEVVHLANHGVIHLLGFDHERGRLEASLMQRAEDWVLDRYQELLSK